MSEASKMTAYERTKKLLEDNYNKDTALLNKNKSTAQQNVAITMEKLKKYLPTQLKNQGLTGLGTSETAMLQANNQYLSQLATIDQSYNQQASELQRAYDSNLLTVEREEEERLRQEEREEEERLRQEERQEREYALAGVEATLQNYISSGAYDEATEYMTENKDVLGEALEKNYKKQIELDAAVKAEAEKQETKTQGEKVLATGKYTSTAGVNYKKPRELNPSDYSNKWNLMVLESLGYTGFDDPKIEDGTFFHVGGEYGNGYIKINGTWHKLDIDD